MQGSLCRDRRGISIVEAVVAIAILVTGVIATARLFMMATSANRSARATTMTTVLAQQKMEQLRGLMWGIDAAGFPVSDTTTDISTTPPGAGGSGLSPSPPDSLARDTPGFVDYLDANGAWVGSGPGLAPGTAYVRRWSVEPLPTRPNDTLILQVLVSTRRQRGSASPSNPERRPEEARLVTVKTRKAR